MRIYKRLKGNFKSGDVVVHISVLVLCVTGIVMIGSASVGGVSNYGVSYALRNIVKQSIFVLSGLILMVFVMNVFRTKFLSFISISIMYVVGIFSMLLCLLSSTKGARAWIKFGSISIQPAEFMKIAMILLLAYFLTEIEQSFRVKGKFKDDNAKLLFYKRKRWFCVFLPLLLITIVFIVGIFLQNDAGTTFIIIAICGLLFFAVDSKYYRRYKAGVLILMVIGSYVGYKLFQGYQMNRIYSWLDPLSDPFAKSYQLLNSMIAFTNGNFYGLGLGQSTQKYGYIPESHNDFIGAIIFEELGIFGLLLIAIPTLIIVHRFLKHATVVEEPLSQMILIGISTYFLIHFLVNLGGVSGLIPMTGVPLLLVSSGGSSVWSGLLSIGIAQAIIKKDNIEKSHNL